MVIKYILALGIAGILLFSPLYADWADSTAGQIADLVMNEQYEEAVIVARKELERKREEFGDHDPRTAMGYNSIGEIYRIQGQYEEAIRVFEEGLALLVPTDNADSHDLYRDPSYARAFSTLYHNMGYVNALRGYYEDAEFYYEKALDTVRYYYDVGHYREQSILFNLATLLVEQKRFLDAESYFNHILELIKAPSHHHDRVVYVDVLYFLSEIQFVKGDFATAERYCRTGIAEVSNSFAPKSSYYDKLLSLNVLLSRIYYEKQDYVMAETILNEALSNAKKKYALYHPVVTNLMGYLVDVYLAQENYAKANALRDETSHLIRLYDREFKGRLK